MPQTHPLDHSLAGRLAFMRRALDAPTLLFAFAVDIDTVPFAPMLHTGLVRHVMIAVRAYFRGRDAQRWAS